MFEDYFFDKHMKTNYRVFRVMKALSATNFSVTRLSQVVGLSYAQTYAAFQAIMKELVTLGVVPAESVNEGDFSRIASAITVDQYRLYLLNQSPAFNLFRYLFTAADPDVHDFCHRYDYNITTLRRRVADYKHYLASCHVTLNPSTWELEGGELQIRLAMQTFFQLGYRGNGWPLPAALDQTVRDHLANLSEAAKQQWFVPTTPTMQDRLALACQLLRLHHGHRMPVTPAFELMLVAQERALPAIFTATETGDAWRAETLYFCFMQLHSLSFEPVPTAATHWLQTRFAALDAAPVAFVNGLVNWLNDHEVAAGGEPNPAPGMAANLYRIAYSFAVVGGNFSRRIDFYAEDDLTAERGDLAACIHAYFKGLPDTGELGRFKPLAPLMASRLYLTTERSYPQLNADHCLKVATLVDPGTFVIRDLLQFLAGIRFVRLLPASDYQAADLIITTLADPAIANANLPTQVPIIHWQSAASDNDYFRLYTRLQRTCSAHNRELAAVAQ